MGFGNWGIVQTANPPEPVTMVGVIGSMEKRLRQHDRRLTGNERRGPTVSSEGLPLGYVITSTDSDGTTVTSTLPTGIWLINGEASASWPTGSGGQITADIHDNNGGPVSGSLVGSAGQSSVLYFPAYRFVSNGVTPDDRIVCKITDLGETGPDPFDSQSTTVTATFLGDIAE